jgi:hypothetical protein
LRLIADMKKPVPARWPQQVFWWFFFEPVGPIPDAPLVGLFKVTAARGTTHVSCCQSYQHTFRDVHAVSKPIRLCFAVTSQWSPGKGRNARRNFP